MKCPTCKKNVPEPRPDTPAERWYPFCSERCKLVDLGNWLDGKYQIPVAPDDVDEQQYRDDPPSGPREIG